MTYRYAILPGGRWIQSVTSGDLESCDGVSLQRRTDDDVDDGDGIDGSDIVAGHLGEYGLDELTDDA